MSPEICIVVDIRIMSEHYSFQKADELHFSEGSSLVSASGEPARHHRGLRPGHVLKRVTWELGRALCLLVNNTGDLDKPVEQYVLAL